MTEFKRSLALTIDGVKLAVTREGVGPQVVCLHSAGHDGRDFDELISRCADSFEFIRLDWPGHGRSGPDHVQVSAERYAQLAEGVVAELEIDGPIVIGNSIGGAAAILYASHRPVRGVVLCDSGGLVPAGAQVRAFCGLFERFFAAGARGAWWYPTIFDLYYRVVLMGSAARERRREIVAGARDLAPLLQQAWASFGRPEADLREVAATLDAPIWVAWAKADRVIPLSLVRPALARMKSARLSLFKGGHTPFLEQPEAFAAEFLGVASRW